MTRDNNAAGFSILLIDDDDVAAEAVVRGLRKQEVQFPIVLAEDGSVALEILRGTHASRQIKNPIWRCWI